MLYHARDANMTNKCRWNGDIGWPTQPTYYIQSQRPTQKKLPSHNLTCTRSCWSAGTGTPSRGPPLSSSPTCLRTSTSRRSLSIWNRHSRCWTVQRDPRRTTCYRNQALTFNYGREMEMPTSTYQRSFVWWLSWYPLSAANSQFTCFWETKIHLLSKTSKTDKI